MTGACVRDFVIPACRDGALLVPKGHILRLIDVEGSR
jgi:uncharacterized protein YcgI (DUF1989 family)